MDRSTGAVTAPSAEAGATESTNRLALRILVASLRPTLNWLRSKATSNPSRPLDAQYRIASAPYRAIRAMGSSVALLADLDSFLRSGSLTKPEIAASDHGSTPWWYSARTIE